MTKKHFIEIAREMKNARKTANPYGDSLHFYADEGFNDGLDRAIEEMCSVFIKVNSNFDKDRFRIAAGYQER